jgi:hypothetical protein
MTIDDIPSFDIPAAVDRLTKLWGWLGEDAAQDILDCLAPDIQNAIRKE